MCRSPENWIHCCAVSDSRFETGGVMDRVHTEQMRWKMGGGNEGDRLMRTADFLLYIQNAVTVDRVSAVLTDFR